MTVNTGNCSPPSVESSLDGHGEADSRWCVDRAALVTFSRDDLIALIEAQAEQIAALVAAQTQQIAALTARIADLALS